MERTNVVQQPLALDMYERRDLAPYSIRSDLDFTADSIGVILCIQGEAGSPPQEAEIARIQDERDSSIHPKPVESYGARCIIAEALRWDKNDLPPQVEGQKIVPIHVRIFHHRSEGYVMVTTNFLRMNSDF